MNTTTTLPPPPTLPAATLPPSAMMPTDVHLNDWIDAQLARVNEAVTLDGFWRAVVQLFHKTMPIQSCSMMYAIVDSSTLAARHHVCVDQPADRQQTQLASNLAIASKFLARHPQIKMYTFSEILTEDPSAHDRALQQQNAFSERWVEFVHLAFWDGSDLEAVFSIRRGHTQGRFSAAELALLLRFHPVINAGLHRIRALGGLQEQRAALERFFSRCPIPVLFLDSRLRLLYATQEALEMSLIWNYGPDVARTQHPRKGFQVPADLAEVCQKLLRMETGDFGRKSTEEVRVCHAKDKSIVARVRADYPAQKGWLQPTLSITYCTEKNLDGARHPVRQPALDLLQRLSANERRVALLASEGCSNTVIAEKLGKSARTVECQLTGIFRKLEVVNRVQLARQLA